MHSVSFIGSGNVATNLAKLLYQKGFSVHQVYSKNKFHSQTLAEFVDASICEDLKNFDLDVDFIFVAVSDNQITDVLSMLKNLTNAVVLHCSGTVSIEVLKNFSKNFGVFYPLQTFTKKALPTNLNFPIFVEANNSDILLKIIALAKSISDNVEEANTEKRMQIHLSAVFANNFINHLLGISKIIAQQSNVSFNCFFPLINETITKALHENPFQIQTGPAKRNDLGTIHKHHQLLQNYDANFSFIYDSITKSIKEG